jgi:uncharacterized SAM-binding protein YcdF (DUF218 family)
VMTAALLGRRGLSRVILVSDGYHLPRARFLFRLAGLVVVAMAAAPMPPWTALLPLVLRETAAFAKSLGLAAVGAHRGARNKPSTDANR